MTKLKEITNRFWFDWAAAFTFALGGTILARWSDWAMKAGPVCASNGACRAIVPGMAILPKQLLRNRGA